MANVPYDMWAGYYRLLLTREELDPDRLLDVCCGTGSVAEQLECAGYEVTGFDLSAAMIEVANNKAVTKGLRAQFLVADATDFELGETFEGAYSFFDSLNYIADLGQFRKAIHQVGKHLEPGGSFVFDLNTEFAFEQKLFDQVDQRKRAPIRYDWRGEYDPVSRVIRVEMEFERNGNTFHETHVQRAHSDEEVRAALEDAGFTGVRVYESYTLDAPRRTSDRVHYFALKP